MKNQQVRSTLCVHGGARREEPYHSITPPLVLSAPFTFESTEELIRLVEGRAERVQPEYGRMGNPTVRRAEQKVAALEGAERAQLFSSGMAAVITLFLATLEEGDHLILTRDCYKRTRDFAVHNLSRFGVRTSIVEPSLEAIRDAVETQTKLILTETPTNPSLYVVDVEGLGALGAERDVLTVVDSTFATPCNLRPLELGVDLVLHSATKYLGGHNDLIAGVVAGPNQRVEPISDLLMTVGAICDATTAFLLHRGLKTLALRVEKHNANGMEVARFLERHPAIERVLYPGLPSHPQHELAKGLLAGYGGVVTFFVRGGLPEARQLVDGLQIPRIAPSLGGTESLVEPAAVMGYWDVPREQREALGIYDNMVRLSLGIEEAEDIVADLGSALEAL